MLRRTKTIAFRDDPEPETPAASGGTRRLDRSGLERLRTDAPRGPHLHVEPDPEPVEEDAAAAPNGAHQRLDDLRAALERAPISSAAPESLAALRAEFRRKHIESVEEGGNHGLGAGFDWRGALKPTRLVLLLVALGAGGGAAWLATQGAPATPVPTVAAQPEPAVPPPPAPTARVLVATADIGIGQRLTPATVAWQAWPEAALRPDYVTATPEAIADMAGTIARFEFVAGEPIRASKLVRADQGYLSAVLAPGMRGVSLTINAAAAAGGYVVPNDRVDVVLTRGTAAGQVSRTIARNARVLAIDTRLGELGTTGAPADPDNPRAEIFSGTAIAILELDPAQAEIVVNSIRLGELSLVLRAMSDFTDQSDDSAAANQAIRMTSPFWTGMNGPQ